MISKGQLDAVKFGRRVVIKGRSLERLFATKEKSPAATELESVNQNDAMPQS
jgi:mRNA degradation ribonuclease J1/J2